METRPLFDNEILICGSNNGQMQKTVDTIKDTANYEKNSVKNRAEIDIMATFTSGHIGGRRAHRGEEIAAC